MKWLVPPATFSEGQRALYGCLVALAGMFAGAMCIGLIAILVLGVWLKVVPVPLYAQIITIFGWALGGFICAMVAVILSLAVGGPVGRFKGGVSKDGANFELEDHDSTSSIETTTTTTVKPPGGS